MSAEKMALKLGVAASFMFAFVSSFPTFVPSNTRSSVQMRPLHVMNFFGGANNNKNKESPENSNDGSSSSRRRLEFKDLEPIEETQVRRERLELEVETKAQFEEFGDNLWDLRSEMEKLSHRLVDAIGEGEESVQEFMREKLRVIERRDPELVYMVSVAELERAKKEGNIQEIENFKAKAAAARSCLPQFNLDGLWVGKYGSKYDLINITYVGDTLIAEKVTGENNVPKGAISFQVDLHPLRRLRNLNHYKNEAVEDSDYYDEDDRVLQPIVLTEKAAAKWGTRKLPRYSGLGQVAEENYKNNQWLDGQLIIIGDEYFSFAWLPIEQQIFFGRPSPELALKMLRDDDGTLTRFQEFDSPPSLTADIKVQKNFVARCLEKTHDHEDELDGNNAFGGIWHCNDNDGDEYYFE